MKKSITIGDLKKAIKDLPDDLPVYARGLLEDKNDGYCLSKVGFERKSAILNENFCLTLSEGFNY